MAGDRFKYEHEMTPIVSAWLLTCGLGVRVIREATCSARGVCDLVGIRTPPRVGRLIPVPELLVAVELKLKSVTSVMEQATANRTNVNLSFAAMPEYAVDAMRPTTIKRFKSEGIGLLSVGESVRVSIPATHYGFWWDEYDWMMFGKGTKRRCWRWTKPYRVMRGD